LRLVDLGVGDPSALSLTGPEAVVTAVRLMVLLAFCMYVQDVVVARVEIRGDFVAVERVGLVLYCCALVHNFESEATHPKAQRWGRGQQALRNLHSSRQIPAVLEAREFSPFRFLFRFRESIFVVNEKHVPS